MRPYRGWMAPISRHPWVGLLALALLLGFAFQGSRGLWSTDEGRYTDGALQMLASGNYLIPAYSRYRVNLAKPPLTYWAIAGAVKVFGRNTWAVRAPYAVAFVLTIMLLYGVGRVLLPDKAWLPGLIYASAAVPFLAANIVSTDTLLTLFEALAALGFVRLWFGNQLHHHRRDALLMWLGLGLAFLTKGPPGLILLLAVIPFVIVQDGWRGLGRVFRPLGMVVFLVVGLGWYGIVALREPGVLHYFLHRQIYQRLFTGAQHRHPGPFGWAAVYVPTLVLGSLPWWPALFRNWRCRFHGLSGGQGLRQHPVELFLLLWFWVPLLVFCLAQSRLPLYVLPLFLPMAVLLAIALRNDIDLCRLRQGVLISAWVIILLGLKGGVAYFVHPANDERLAAHQLVSTAPPGAYDAVVFVENTPYAYAVQERIPWGLRMYLGKPIYGVASAAPGGATRLCRVMHGHHTNLLLLAKAITESTVDAIAQHCPVRSFDRLGSWRHYALVLVTDDHDD